MRRYNNTVVNPTGQAIAQANITVTVAAVPPGSGAAAQVFSDDGLTSISNTVVADNLGRFGFYVPSGKYDLSVFGGSPLIAVPYIVANEEITDHLEFKAQDTVPLAGEVLNLTEVTTGTVPPAGTTNLYSKTGDAGLFYRNNTGVEVGPLGVGGGGGGTPSGPINSLQKNFGGGTFAPSGLLETGTFLDINDDVQFQGPNPYVDIREFGARAVAFNQAPAIPGCTASINAGSTSATLGSPCGFVNGDGINIWGAGALNVLNPPVAPVVTPSLAQGSTGTGYVVNGPTGSTSYNYQIVAIDVGQGVTAASGIGTTSTGAATLGPQFVNIASQSRVNNTTTVTTATPHGLPVGSGSTQGPLVYIGSGNALTDVTEFGGWFIVNSVADNTHFTYISGNDTRFGVNASTSTGGTATWWNANHLQLPTSNPAGVRQYAIYGRNCPANCGLIGISMPVDTTITSDPTYMTWDDFGPAMMSNASFPAWLPTTAPSIPTNDTLVTTIASGGGTTAITTANAASNNVSGATILIDTAPALLAAAATTNNSGGAVFIPVPTGSILFKFVVNSYTNIGAIAGAFALISQAGPLFLNDTVLLTGGQWHGDLQPSGGNGLMVKPSFSLESHTPITIGTAYPGIFLRGQASFRGLVFNSTAQNLYNYIFATTGGPVIFEDVVFGGGGGNDLMGVQYYGFCQQGGGFGGLFRNFSFTAGTPNNSTVTPFFISKNNGEWNFRYGSMANRGLCFIGGTNGGVNVSFDLGEENQSGSMPLIAFMSRGVGGSITWLGGSLDTDANAGVANWGSPNSASLSFNGPLSGTSGLFSFLTGNPFASINGGGVITVPQIGQNFNFIGQGQGFVGVGVAPIQLNRITQVLGPNYSLYTDPGTPPAPTCTPITAGPPFAEAGTFTFQYIPVYQNGGQGLPSQLSVPCTANGTSQQLSITTPASLAGVSSLVWVYLGNNYPDVNGVHCSHITTAPTLNWTYMGGSCGFQSLPTFPGGGPSGITGGMVWANNLSLGFTLFASLGSSPNGTFMYCQDCNIASPCTGGGTGALAKRLNGIWVCN